MTSRVIPNYALYGDLAQPSWKNTFDFEWIPQRSRSYNWKIRPHQHDAFIQILYLTQGSVEATIDNAKVSINAPCLLLLPAQTVHGFVFSEDVDGPVVTAAQRPLESLASACLSELLPFIRKPAVIPLDITSDHKESLMPLFLALEREARIDVMNQMSAEVALLLALCVQMSRLAQFQKTVSLNASSRKTMQIERFRTMVNEGYKKHLPLTAYADQLGITVGQLSRLCREVLGASSLDVVNARLIHEAQRDLVYTISSVKQVADSLGFADETYFGRFFRKHTGLSPRAFRTKALQAMIQPEAIES